MAGAAEDGRIGMLFARCGLKPCELFAKGLRFNGSPTEAIELCGLCKTPVIVASCTELKLFQIVISAGHKCANVLESPATSSPVSCESVRRSQNLAP